ncbi:MAG TPA: sodium:solute symporter family protein [Verrucomicrobiae bacterium]|nr:sodium:solute symporter family protein [Verrucomicrobiae bacterium]
MNALVAFSIVALVVVGTILFALFSLRRFPSDPQQYLVGGRSFGTILLWVLLAGEIYTSFTFLGAAGWAYGYGAPAFYILAYGTCGYVIGYFLLPAVWRVANERRLLTGPDFFLDRYGSRALAIGIALLQFAALVPYVTLQLSGLQTILRIIGYGGVDSTLAVTIAFVAIVLFVFTAGLRGTAWASVVKDLLVLGAVVFAGIVIPTQFFGSPAAMFDQLLRTHPSMLSLAPGTAPRGTVWFVTTVLMTGIGFYMNPASMNATYSARSENVLRRNAMLLPLYQLVMLLVFMAGFAALLIAPGLHGAAVDQSFLLVVQRYYPPWVMGVVAAAGALAALVPSSALLLGAAGVFAKNVLGDGLGIATSERGRMRAMRVLVLVVGALSLAFWAIERDKTIVELLLLYYNGITQLAPGMIAAFVLPRATAGSVAAGIAAGLAVVVYLVLTGAPFFGINPGFAGLVANVAVLLLFSRPSGSSAAT